jgi:hypothetical protein
VVYKKSIRWPIANPCRLSDPARRLYLIGNRNSDSILGIGEFANASTGALGIRPAAVVAGCGLHINSFPDR